MTEYTLPRLPAQSDARQFSTLSAPLLFCHCLKEQQPTTSQPTASQPTTQPELTTQQTLTGQQTLTTQQTLTGQRLEALTFVTLTGCRCGEAEVEKDSGCNDRLSFYLACFEVSPQPDWQFCLALSDEACAQSLVTAVCSAQHASTSDPHITISRSGGENLEGVFWGVLIEFPISLLNGCQSPILHLTYRRDEVLSSPFADGSARLHCI